MLSVTIPATIAMSANTAVNSTSEKPLRAPLFSSRHICGLQQGQDRREGDEAYERDQPQNKQRFKYSRQPLGGGGDLLVIIYGEAVEHFFQPARLLADGKHPYHDRRERARLLQ